MPHESKITFLSIPPATSPSCTRSSAYLFTFTIHASQFAFSIFFKCHTYAHPRKYGKYRAYAKPKLFSCHTYKNAGGTPTPPVSALPPSSHLSPFVSHS